MIWLLLLTGEEMNAVPYVYFISSIQSSDEHELSTYLITCFIHHQRFH